MATKKSTTRKPTTRKKNDTPVYAGLMNEIILLVTLALALILLLGNFGMGGAIGSAFSYCFFGLFGFLSFVFPFVLFLGVALLLANTNNIHVIHRVLIVFASYLLACALLHLIMNGYHTSNTVLECFDNSGLTKTGGGLIGGGIAIILASAFGIVGAYVIIIIALFILAILFTRKPLLKQLKTSSSKTYQTARQHHEVRRANIKSRRENASKNFFEETTLVKKETMAQDDTTATTKVEKPRKKERLFQKSTHENEDNEELLQVQDPFLETTPAFQIHRAQDLAIPTEKEDTDSSNNISSKEIPKEQETLKAQETHEMHEISPERKKNPRSSEHMIKESIDYIQEEIEHKDHLPKPEYKYPPLSLLKRGTNVSGDSDKHLQKTALKLQQTLHNFGVNVTVTNVSCGPTVTRYELQPEQGVKVSRITNLADDIKLNLAAADIRIEAPIPGKAAVGIEVPNANNSTVALRDLLQSDAFIKHESSLAFAAGKNIAGSPVITDIAKMPHLLIAGATGSGKSVCINTLIMSILYKANPDDVKLIMIDPKVVELSVYNGIPHLFIPVVTEPKKAAGALNWAVVEMNDRYNKFAEYGVRDLKSYNAKVASIADIEEEDKPTKLPQIVIIVDELADLMMVAPGEVEDAICRLAQLARAAGIHLIIATQRPSVNVITGLIKANMPSRIAFSVSSGVDSRTILDMNGAEKLLGKGDMLFYPQGYPKPARVQGAFVSDKEVGDVVEFLTKQNEPHCYNDEVVQKINNASAIQSNTTSSTDDIDAYFVDAGKFIIEKDKASIGMLQRVFKIGFNRAARIMDQLCEAGVVGEEEGTKPRKVLMVMEEFENYIEESL